ncbi:hypothetical protein Rcae01_04117 [Novipirellula caenicola]|uniref:Uncharacterized protein n=1 Tax=Novipirellula caenicola TaxID=1536901 RepID=A0ABP9VU58_9BACT
MRWQRHQVVSPIAITLSRPDSAAGEGILLGHRAFPAGAILLAVPNHDSRFHCLKVQSD